MKKPKFKYWLLYMMLFAMAGLYGQKQITGQVTDASGQPLPGVSVIVKGTSNGVSTDFDGNYEISNVNDEDMLLFSYLGFKSQEVQVLDQNSIDVIMLEDVTQLDDVIVVGYGTKKKTEVAGSVAQVSGELTKRNPEVNFATSLAGRLPGLVVNQTSAQPGREGIRVLVRGVRTFDSDTSDGVDPTQPLIVIDGVIGADGLTGLNSQDIENISILKDASAAIYGSRAANGVILVTTKRGKSGKPVFDYSINTGIVTPTRYADRASALEFATMARAIIDRDPSASVPAFSDEQLAEFAAPGFRSTDWFREVYDRSSIQTRHNFSFRGGTDLVSYFTSLSFANREGIVVSDNVTDIKQYNFRSNLDVRPTDNLKLSFDVAGRFDRNQFFGSNAGDVSNATSKGLPFEPATTADGRPLRTSLTNGNINALTYVQDGNGYRRDRNTRFNGKLGITYQFPFLKGLGVETWGAVRLDQNYFKSFDRPFLQYDIDDNGNVVEDIIDREVRVGERFFRDIELTYHFNLNYQNTFGNHSLNAFLAYEQSVGESNATTAARRGFLANNIDQLNAGSIDTQVNDNEASETGRQNYIGRFGYDFAKKYFFQFHFRYDGSFNFADGNNFGFFPGAEVAWRVSEENFLKDNQTLSNLKLRGSWGRLGNDLIHQFQYLNRFGNDGSFPLGTGTLTDFSVVSQIGSVANPAVTWETAENINLGIEAGFLQNRLTFELDLWKENRTDILAPRRVSVPDFTGITNRPNENIGETKSQGIDAIVGYRSKIGKVDFSIEGNVSLQENELVFQDAVDPVEPYQNLEGRPIGSRLVYNAIGIYRTQSDLDNNPGLANAGIGDLIYADTNEDGVLGPEDRIVLEETRLPNVQFGLNLGLDYKGIGLYALFQGQAGSTDQITAIFTQADLSYILSNAYTPENPNAILPRIGSTESARNGYSGGDNSSTFWQRDLSFVRLRNVELSYTLPKEIISTIGVSNLRLYVSGSNLLTFDGIKKDGLGDPEQGLGLSTDIPLQKIFNFGANITF
ncbi:MAG: SusC/RagA family TonB-linked outer membrane protein [Allomuricauda sp.]